MKFLVYAIVSIVAGWPAVVSAAPFELEVLQSKRKQEIKKIDEQYVVALKKLKAKYTEAGRPDDAALVQTEIESKLSNRLVGKWHYSHDGRDHFRVFAEDTVTLWAEVKKGEPVKEHWKKKYRLVSPTTAIVEGDGLHEIREDGKLKIQGAPFVGERVAE